MNDISPERFKEVVINGNSKLQIWTLPDGVALTLVYENDDSLVEMVYPMDHQTIVDLASNLIQASLDYEGQVIAV